MEARGISGSKEWEDLLNKLAACITPQEEAAARLVAADRGSPGHLRQLHDHVAGLLVKHRLATWDQLNASFPGYIGSSAGDVQERLGPHSKADDDAWQNRAGEGSVASSRERASKDAANADELGRQSSDHDVLSAHLERKNLRAMQSQGMKRKANDRLDGTPRRPKKLIDEETHQESGALSPLEPEHKKRGVATSNAQPGNRSSTKRGTLAIYPRIVSWWHPTKNGTTLPEDYKYDSPKRVWLQCPGCPTCGEVHEWHARPIYLATTGEIGCRFCAGRRGSICSCRTISANERLAAEWHEDNSSPAEVSQGSREKYKWRCADAGCRYVWEARPGHRSVEGGTNCPACAMKKMPRGRHHPSLADGRPELLREWSKRKNSWLPTEVSCGSNKLVWWLCQTCGNSWQSKVKKRALEGRGCPKCCRRN